MQVRPIANGMHAELARSIHFPRHDYVRGLSREGDCDILASEMLRELDGRNDLRFLISQPEAGLELAVMAERLPWDSAFFGCDVARLHGIFSLGHGTPPSGLNYSPAVHELCRRAARGGVRYVFAQVDARDLPLSRALGEAGFSVIETRLTYHRELASFSWPERYPTRRAGPADAQSLAFTARHTVNRFDRFHADPFFDVSRVEELMGTWVKNSIEEGFADYTICPDEAEPRAFCTCRYHKENWEAWGKRVAQPVFSAVSPTMKGWYRKLIVELSYHLKDQGAEHAFMVTQAGNGAVVHVWESLGYRLGRCENVLRKVI